jgi:UDP-N-acetylglucosamine 2-epimerase (non-hydrolysing)
MKIAIICGTMPDIIKLAPLVWEGDKRGHDIKIVHTNQHKDKHFTDTFDSIGLRRPDKVLSGNAIHEFEIGTAINQLTKVFDELKPDIVFVHGDTKTAMVGAIAAHFLCIPVAHIEAGLRTDTREPWPEQTDTRIADACSNLFFAATDRSVNKLLDEGFNFNDIYLVGNTIVDIAKKISNVPIDNFDYLTNEPKKVYFSAHREENMRFKTRFMSIVKFANFLAKEGYEVNWVMRNKTITKIKEYNAKLSPKIKIVDFLKYPDSIKLLNESYFVCTDSGGLQEEASALHKPCLTMRYVTDRPETVDNHTNICTGFNLVNMKHWYNVMLADYSAMSNKPCPYGEGNSSKKIFNIVEERKKNLIRWEK